MADPTPVKNKQFSLSEAKSKVNEIGVRLHSEPISLGCDIIVLAQYIKDLETRLSALEQ